MPHFSEEESFLAAEGVGEFIFSFTTGFLFSPIKIKTSIQEGPALNFTDPSFFNYRSGPQKGSKPTSFGSFSISNKT